MNTIKPITSVEVLEQRIQKINKNTAWIQTGNKIEIALLIIAVLGFISFALADTFGHLNTLSSSILVGSTMGGVVIPCVIGFSATNLIKKYLNKQNQAIEEHLENWLFNSLFNDYEKENEVSKVLEKLTNKQWTRLINDVNDHLNHQKPSLDENYWKKEITFLGQLLNYPEQLADNFFFIDQPFYQLLRQALEKKGNNEKPAQAVPEEVSEISYVSLKDLPQQQKIEEENADPAYRLMAGLGWKLEFLNNQYRNPRSENFEKEHFENFILTTYETFTNSTPSNRDTLNPNNLDTIINSTIQKIENMSSLLENLRMLANTIKDPHKKYSMNRFEEQSELFQKNWKTIKKNAVTKT